MTDPGEEVKGDEVLHMLASTMPETVDDTVRALQKVYQQGRADREAEIQAGVLKATEELRQELQRPGTGFVPESKKIRVDQDAATLREHLVGWHYFSADEVAKYDMTELLYIHGDADHPHPSVRTD